MLESTLLAASGQSKLSAELYSSLQEFIAVNKANQIADLAANYSERKKSLDVDFTELAQFNPSLADELIASPDMFLQTARDILQRLNPHSQLSPIPYKPHFRVYNLPDVA